MSLRIIAVNRGYSLSSCYPSPFWVRAAEGIETISKKHLFSFILDLITPLERLLLLPTFSYNHGQTCAFPQVIFREIA